MNITIKPVRPCKNEPIFIKCDECDTNITCAVDDKGNCFPAQKTDDGIIVSFLDDKIKNGTVIR